MSSGGRRDTVVGCGTIRGAGEIVPRFRCPALRGKPGVGRGGGGGGIWGRAAAAACSAIASATGSAVSPSKNFAIAIWWYTHQ